MRISFYENKDTLKMKITHLADAHFADASSMKFKIIVILTVSHNIQEISSFINDDDD